MNNLMLRLGSVLLSMFCILSLTVALPADDTGCVIKPGDRIAILGDSITEQKLYSKFVESYLLACMPQLKVTVMQFGWGAKEL